MSWKRGMQWKTPWRRQTGLGETEPVDMWFLDLGNGYTTAAPPVPGFAMGNPTFWLGLVTRQNDTASFDYGAGVGEATASTGVRLEHRHQDAVALTLEPMTAWAEYEDAATLDSVIEYVTKYLPAAAYRVGSVLVSLFLVETVGADTQISIWMDGGLRIQATLPAFVPAPTAAAFMQSSILGTGGNCFHGFVAGTSLPTEQEIRDWFAAVRNLAEIQEIPGKTTDMISAAAVAPLAPDPLLNLSTGPDFALSGGVASNAQLPAYFNY